MLKICTGILLGVRKTKRHDCNKVGAIIRNVRIKKVGKIWRQHEYVEKKRRK
jgi:hypothetical protein